MFKKRDPDPTTISYRDAVSRCRYWYLRWERLPPWRRRARNKALGEAMYWGAVAIKAKKRDK